MESMMDTQQGGGGGGGGGGEDGPEPGTMTLKLLIAGSAAGSVIGKGGSTINEFQTQTGARIQLSRNSEVFPGTTDRLVTLSGTPTAILGVIHLMINKLTADGEGTAPAGGGAPQVKLVIPNASCGCIIGKAGATIRSFVEDSGAEIKLSSQDRMLPGVTDRVLTISGAIEQVLRAVALVATALSQDSGYEALAARPSTFAAQPMGMQQQQQQQQQRGGGHYGHAGMMQQGMMGGMMGGAQGMMMPQGMQGMQQQGMQGMQGMQGFMPQAGPPVSMAVAVPDEHIGGILGKGGRTISEIQVLSGVRIKVSDRGDFVEGTRNRKVTLTGTAEGVQIAQYLLAQKLHASAAVQGSNNN